MAGSLAHLVDKDGRFNMSLIENFGDAYEALEDCYMVIYHLAGGDTKRVSEACQKAGTVDPWDNDRTADDPMPAPMKPESSTRLAPKREADQA